MRARGPGLLERASLAWKVHDKLLLGALALVLSLCVAWLLTRSALDPELARQRAMSEVLSAWLTEDDDLLRAEIGRFEQEYPEQEAAIFFRALAGDPVVREVTDALVATLLDGERAMRSGEYEKAVHIFHQARNQAPGTALSMVPLGVAALEARDFELAQRTLGYVAGTLLPFSCDLHRMLGASYFESGAYEATTLAMATAGRMCPEDPRVWSMLARAWAAAKTPLPQLHAPACSEALDDPETHAVTRGLVTTTWIPEPDDELHEERQR